MNRIRIIIPCYNEEENIFEIYRNITKEIESDSQIMSTCNISFLYINDGSTDGTWYKINELVNYSDAVNVDYINLSRNFGKESAMMAGIDNSLDYDAVIFVDADGQDSPKVIPQMIREYMRGYDDVYAKRTHREDSGRIDRFLTQCFYWLMGRTSKFDIPSNVGDFRLLDKKCLQALSSMRERNRYTKGIFAYIGYKKKEILFERPNREIGKSKWNLAKRIGFAVNALIDFSTVSYKLPLSIGAILMILGVSWLFIFPWDEPKLRIDLLVLDILTALSGVIFFCTGILAKILSVILQESKQRPSYFIQDKS